MKYSWEERAKLSLLVASVVVLMYMFIVKPPLSDTPIPCNKITVQPHTLIHKHSLSMQDSIDYNISRLSELLYFECGYKSCTEAERNLILDVVFWRLQTGYRGAKTIQDVIESPKQFSYLDDLTERIKYPNPDNITDFKELRKIQVLARSTYLNYIYDNEDVNSYKVLTNKVIMYYNPDKVSKTPDWVNEKCRVKTLDNFLHRFYSCYKLK